MNKSIMIKVVSLKTSLNRRSYINSLMKKYHIEYSFFDAINGKESKVIDYYNKSVNSHFLFNRKYLLSPSEFGCMKSHLLILENFVKYSEQEWLLVLEDDVIYDEKFLNFLNSIDLSKLNNKIYILGGQEGLKSRHLLFGSYETINDYKFKHIYKLCNRWIYRTCCYLINKEVAIKMLEVYKNYNVVADDWSFIVKKGKIEGISLLEIIKHPENLQDSLIEQERI